MTLLDVPIPVLTTIFNELVRSEGVQRAVRYRLTCST